MSVGKCLGIGGVAALPILCCAGSSVLVGLGSAALSGWLVASGYVLVPILLVAVGVAAIVLYRRRRAAVAADDCCGTVGSARRLRS
jgi:uncharacterized membrane protein